MPRFPLTAASAVGLSDRVFSRLAARAKSHLGVVHPLHVGDTWMQPLPEAMAEAQRTEDHPRLHGYAPVQGEPALLEAITAHLRRRGDQLIDPAGLQVVSGATAGLSVVTEALLEPGDEVLLPAPFWPLIRGIIQKRGAKAVQVPLYDRVMDDTVDVRAALEAAITERTVAIYVNTPHNPTGVVLTDQDIAAIAEVAERHDLWILSDEVYEELYLEGMQPHPVWARADYQRRCVAVHSVSKAYGLAGARVGWVHGPPEAMEAVRGVQTFSTYCASRPMQLGAAKALSGGAEWLARARQSYRDAAHLTASTLGIPTPAGGTFVFFDITDRLREGEDTLALLERCLDAGVLLTPGVACGQHYADWVRLCFTAVPPDELEDALSRLAPILAG
ncbi:MAG TPA: pyridoxal phosphate-dependent aminotransferase [Polyangiaceae bacterium]|nr:pyridoxal phosphate-dependent aminotransferase [Polyangiaceae bacterium]